MAAEQKKGQGRERVTDLTERLAKPILEEMGLTLWDVTFCKEGIDWCLTVYIDRPEGATLDDCEAVSRALDPLLDEADPVEQGYYLQVFTPGLERKLTRAEHFEQYTGRKIFLRTIRPAEDGRRDFKGILQGFDGKNLTLNEAGTERNFALPALSYVKADDFDAEAELQES